MMAFTHPRAVAILAALPWLAVMTASPSEAQSSWTGPYIGLTAAGSWGKGEWRDPGPVDLKQTARVAVTPADSDVDGTLWGGKVGYRGQIAGFVWGVEGEAGLSYARGSTTCSVSANVGEFTATCRDKDRHYFQATAQAGLALTSNLLVFGFAGVKHTTVEFVSVNPDVLPPGIPPIRRGGINRASEDYVMPVLGIGVDFKITPNLLIGLSYTHEFSSTERIEMTGVRPDGTNSSHTVRHTRDPDVIGASLRVPLQQQAAQAADAGAPAAQTPASQPAAARPQSQAQTPARATTPRPTPAAAATTPAVPAAKRPVQGTPAEPDTPTVKGRTDK